MLAVIVCVGLVMLVMAVRCSGWELPPKTYQFVRNTNLAADMVELAPDFDAKWALFYVEKPKAVPESYIVVGVWQRHPEAPMLVFMGWLVLDKQTVKELHKPGDQHEQRVLQRP